MSTWTWVFTVLKAQLWAWFQYCTTQIFKTVWGVMGTHSQWVSFASELIWPKLSDASVVAPSYLAVLEPFIITIKMLFELKFS